MMTGCLLSEEKRRRCVIWACQGRLGGVSSCLSFGFGRPLSGGLLPGRGKSGHHKAARPVKAGDARVQGRADGKCHRKQTAFPPSGEEGKGEKVR